MNGSYKIVQVLLMCLVLVVVVSCGGDDDDDDNGPSDLIQIASTTIVDIANNGNASDIQIYINERLEGERVDEYRAILVKSEQASSFDLDQALNVDPANYTTLDTESLDLVLNSDLNDVDGDAIVEGVEYVAFVVSVSGKNSRNMLSSPSPSLTLEQKTAVRNLTIYFDAGSGGMDSDEKGDIFMGDFGASLDGPPGTKVYKISATGDVSVFAEGLFGASGNEFDSKGNFYQSNISAGTVSKINASGGVSTFASNTLQGPVGITFDSEDNMYVVNCSKNDISKITPSGNATVFVASPRFNCPNGITIDEEGNLYVANFGNGNILKVTPDQTVSNFASTPGNNNGHILYQNGLLWVVDRGGHAIYTITLDGVRKKFAGVGVRGNLNGDPLKSSFSLPNDLTFSPDGKLVYVNDVDTKARGRELSPVIIRVIEIVDP